MKKSMCFRFHPATVDFLTTTAKDMGITVTMLLEDLANLGSELIQNNDCCHCAPCSVVAQYQFKWRKWIKAMEEKTSE